MYIHIYVFRICVTNFAQVAGDGAGWVNMPTTAPSQIGRRLPKLFTLIKNQNRTSLKHFRTVTESFSARQKPCLIGRFFVVAPGDVQSTPFESMTKVKRGPSGGFPRGTQNEQSLTINLLCLVVLAIPKISSPRRGEQRRNLPKEQCQIRNTLYNSYQLCRMISLEK